MMSDQPSDPNDKKKPAFPFAPNSGDKQKKPNFPTSPEEQQHSSEPLRPPSDVNLDEGQNPQEGKRSAPSAPKVLINPVTGQPIVPKSQREYSDTSVTPQPPAKEKPVDDGGFTVESEPVPPPPPGAGHSSLPPPPPKRPTQPWQPQGGGISPPPTRPPLPASSSHTDYQHSDNRPGSWNQGQYSSSSSDHVGPSADAISSMSLDSFLGEPEPDLTVVTPQSVMAAGGAAVVGGFAWMITFMIPYVHFFSIILALVAVGVGYGIGETSNRIGGRGGTNGMICAGFTVLALSFGTMLGQAGAIAVGMAVNSVRPVTEKEMARHEKDYEREKSEHQRFVALASQPLSATKQYMFNNAFVSVGRPELISDAEANSYLAQNIQYHEEWLETFPTLKDYTEEALGKNDEIQAPVASPLAVIPIYIGFIFIAALFAYFAGAAKDGD